jgi:OmpA-OmpF porin, OOP family
MKTRNYVLAVSLAVTALALPLAANAKTPVYGVATPSPVGVVTDHFSVGDYPVLIKSYDETRFHSGRAQLTAQEKSQLREFASALHNMNYRIIDIAGHADPVGSVPRNQRLAHERAAAVRAYLVARGVDSQRIFTEAQPVRAYGRCAGDHGSAQRKCLAPDRSTDVKALANAVEQVSVNDISFGQVRPIAVN